MKSSTNILGQVLVAASIASFAMVGYFAAGKYLELRQVEIENEARYQCALSSKYELNNVQNSTTVSYPVAELYEKCLREKNL